MTERENCNHPKSDVRVADTGAQTSIGEAPPRFWTIIGECECGELVEIDYEFNKITD